MNMSSRRHVNPASSEGGVRHGPIRFVPLPRAPVQTIGRLLACLLGMEQPRRQPLLVWQAAPSHRRAAEHPSQVPRKMNASVAVRDLKRLKMGKM